MTIEVGRVVSAERIKELQYYLRMTPTLTSGARTDLLALLAAEEARLKIGAGMQGMPPAFAKIAEDHFDELLTPPVATRKGWHDVSDLYEDKPEAPAPAPVTVSMADIVTMLDTAIGLAGDGRGAAYVKTWLMDKGVEVKDED